MSASGEFGLRLSPVLGGLAFGAIVAWRRPAAAVLTLAGALVFWVLLRRSLTWWDMFLFALAGLVILGYGFANIGLRIADIPIPAVEIVLALLLLVAMSEGLAVGLPNKLLVLVALFLALASVRLMFDFWQWRQLALRDFTLPLETTWLLVGAWAMQRFGLERWLRGLQLAFLGLLAYLSLQPWAAQLQAISPQVGLQQEVPLFGDFWSVGTAAAAGMLFFGVMRPWGVLSYLLAAAFMPTLVIAQLRGLYLAVPAAILVMWLVAGKKVRAQVRSGLVATVLLAAFAAALVFPLTPQGRVGPVAPGTIIAQLATLTGGQGPGAGSFSRRLQWVRDVTTQVREEHAWLVGVGLGPDLVAGFSAGEEGPLVRKPHNDYLEVFGRLGLPGLLLFLGILGSALRRVIRGTRLSDGQEGRFLAWVLGSSVVYLLIAATQPLLSYPFGTVPLFAPLGAALVLAHQVHSKPRARREPGASLKQELKTASPLPRG